MPTHPLLCPLRRATFVLGTLALGVGCSEGSGGSFASSQPTGITSASGTTDSGSGHDLTGPTTDVPSGTSSTAQPTTSAETSTTSGLPCAELTLCPTTGDSTGTTSPPDATTEPANTDTDDSDDPCHATSDGSYCGATLGGLADHNSLYQCIGGVTSSASPCPAGCENGACKPIQPDPCASAQSGNGLYCGGTLMGGDGGALYNCQNGGTADKQPCSNGCKVNPPGVPDACNPEGDPCQGANSGDGPYCGSGLPGGAANVLYICKAKVTKASETCAAGCQQNPPGVPDACKQQQNGGECCLDVPAGVVTQSFSACGGGGSHYGVDYGTAIGTPIYAGMAGTVVGSALGFPNCYKNGCDMACWNAFNYVKIKADCGDPQNAANDLFIYYLHIDSLAPGVGDGTHLDQGQLVANSGNSGCSSGPHIHIETVSVAKGQNATLNTCASVDPASRYCP